MAALPPALVERALALAADRPRALLGIAGTPGAGKSTLAETLTAVVAAAGVAVAHVPMDGFHLADVALERLGLRDRKGAPETFDASGYAALLRRLRAPGAETVYAPDFARDLEQPVAGSIPVDPAVRLVVTEGNYLLLPEPPWPDVRAALDEVWYVDLPDAVRVPRLLARHERFGKTPAQARAWVAAVDEPNAERVAAHRGSADLLVRIAADGTATMEHPSRR